MYEEYSGLNQNICFDIQSNKEESKLQESHELDEFELSDIDLEDINEEMVSAGPFYSPKVITPLKKIMGYFHY